MLEVLHNYFIIPSSHNIQGSLFSDAETDAETDSQA